MEKGGKWAKCAIWKEIRGNKTLWEGLAPFIFFEEVDEEIAMDILIYTNSW